MKSIGKREAAKQLNQAGQKFIRDFTQYHQKALVLRSSEPGVCWKASGEVAFAVVNEFSGPNSMQDDSPFLLRARVNLYPPAAISYHLRSHQARKKLGVSSKAKIATDPVLEVTTKADETAELGKWLVEWLNAVFNGSSTMPAPPFPLFSWSADAEGRDTYTAATEMGYNWQNYEYLWSWRAIDEFAIYLRKEQLVLAE